MSKFFKAEEVFKELPEDVRMEVFKIAEGKIVYFPKQNNNRKKKTEWQFVKVMHVGIRIAKLVMDWD